MLGRNRSHKKQQDNDKTEEEDMSSSSSSSSSSSPSTDSSIPSEREKELERRRKMQEEPVSLGVQQEPVGPTTPTTPANATINTTSPPAEMVLSDAAAAAAAARAAEGPQRSKSTFENRIDQEFHNAMEEEIKKGVQAIYRRFNMMMAQERTPNDHAVDALGHETDFYENLVDAVQSGDPSAGKTTEEVYVKLYNLTFTGMRSLEALKQEYSITSSS